MAVKKKAVAKKAVKKAPVAKKKVAAKKKSAVKSKKAAAKKATAAPAPKSIGTRQTKLQILQAIAEETDLSRKQVADVFSALGTLVRRHNRYRNGPDRSTYPNAPRWRLQHPVPLH